MLDCYCKQLIGIGIDITTPRNEILTAFYKRSFAHHTVKNRLPVILTQVIDGLVRDKEYIGETYALNGIEDLKQIVGELSKLKYEIQTNKSLYELKSSSPQAKLYNDYIKGHLDLNTTCEYYNTKWLFVECYMYRRIQEAFDITQYLNEYDPFGVNKRASYESALPIIKLLSNTILSMLDEQNSRDPKEDFLTLLKINLWGNKCDLSFSNAKGVCFDQNLILQIEERNSLILADDSFLIWDAVIADNRLQLVDIVLDNSGYELFTDLCLADFIITKKFAEKVRLYVKDIPWFVSDATKNDINWTLEQLKSSDDSNMRILGDKWTEYFVNGIWTIEENTFWTSHHEFKYMYKVDEKLYRRLAKAKLVIFKGDLNYRKLFGERFWAPEADVESSLEGFHPTKLCSLRILKSDIVVGLTENTVKEAESADEDWMYSGNYGVIQYSGKIVRLI